jgi:UDP-glucuronate 4-epimerase
VTILVTGAAGFVGFHVACALRRRGDRVVAVDSFNSYYDPALKAARATMLRALDAPGGLVLETLDITDRAALADLLAREPGITGVVHLAAQAGVRHSLVDPYAYVQANVMGHVTVLEAARTLPGVRHVVYASSSSVYGLNETLPFAETDPVERPSSLYAATKRSDELISQAYAHLYGLPQTGLRFFTVYGPWGRPDMAYYGFAEAIASGREITLYDSGTPRRDFTYIDDVVDGVLRVLDRPPHAQDGWHRLLNIGNRTSEPVSRLVKLLERALGREAVIRHVCRPPADVAATWASVERMQALTGWVPRTGLDEGIARFVAWFDAYRGGGFAAHGTGGGEGETENIGSDEILR